MTRPNYDPLQWHRDAYQVPAFKNRIVRVKHYDKLGVITGASGPHVAVRLSEEKHSRPYHPSDLDYLDERQPDPSAAAARSHERLS